MGTGAAGTVAAAAAVPLAAAALVAAAAPFVAALVAAGAMVFMSPLSQFGCRLNAPAVLTSTPPATSAAVSGFIMVSSSFGARKIPHADEDRDARLGLC